MTLIVDEAHAGTPESVWLPALQSLPPLHLPAVARALIVAPHPDDEVLALGGIMIALARSGAKLTIVAVTDGEASHPNASSITAERMAEIRAKERARALEALGVEAEIVRLHLPDGGVCSSAVGRRLSDFACDLLLAPFERDGHPDHDATGRAARASGATLLRYPVWAWHWARPSELPLAGAFRFELDASSRKAKRAAIDAYRSQIAPIGATAGDRAILPPNVLERFHRPFEVVFP